MLLAGLEVYASVGREWELLETMRKFAHEAEEMVRNTPSAAELKRLFERELLEEARGRGADDGRAPQGNGDADAHASVFRNVAVRVHGIPFQMSGEGAR